MANGVCGEEAGKVLQVASDVQSLPRLPRDPRNYDLLLFDGTRPRVDLLRRLQLHASALSVDSYRCQPLPPRLRALRLLQIHRLL